MYNYVDWELQMFLWLIGGEANGTEWPRSTLIPSPPPACNVWCEDWERGSTLTTRGCLLLSYWTLILVKKI